MVTRSGISAGTAGACISFGVSTCTNSQPYLSFGISAHSFTVKARFLPFRVAVTIENISFVKVLVKHPVIFPAQTFGVGIWKKRGGI